MNWELGFDNCEFRSGRFILPYRRSDLTEFSISVLPPPASRRDGRETLAQIAKYSTPSGKPATPQEGNFKTVLPPLSQMGFAP